MLELLAWVIAVCLCIVGALYIAAVNSPIIEDEDGDV